MLEVILQILSIIGIVLLILFCVVFVVLLLVLFFPITYQFAGSKADDISAVFKAKWFFGFLRVNYEYPETAILSVKVLWHTLFQKKIPQKDADKEEGAGTAASPNKNKEKPKDISKKNQEIPPQDMNSSETEAFVEEVTQSEVATESDCDSIPVQEFIADGEKESEAGVIDKILQKIDKIKYTILNIYDKIKEIWENITYYVELLKEDSTKALFQHAIIRLGKIFKNIRPRHINADILFGTGSPDTTGYAYGVYGMLSSVLGPKFIITPDFERSVCQGELGFSGHITIWVLLINALRLLIDPKLHLFIKKVKAGMPQKRSN